MGPLTVQLLGGNGQPIGAAQTVAGSSLHVTVQIAHPQWAAGFRVRGPQGVTLGGSWVDSEETGEVTYVLNSPFQPTLGSPAWHLTQTAAAYSVFTADHLLPLTWMEGSRGIEHVASIRTSSWGDEWVTVSAGEPVKVVRSVAYLSGWRATATDLKSGVTVSPPVHRHGLIQEITLPPGHWRVHFHYHAPYIELGLLVSAVSSLVLVAVLITLRRPAKPSRARVRVS